MKVNKKSLNSHSAEHSAKKVIKRSNSQFHDMSETSSGSKERKCVVGTTGPEVFTKFLWRVRLRFYLTQCFRVLHHKNLTKLSEGSLLSVHRKAKIKNGCRQECEWNTNISLVRQQKLEESKITSVKYRKENRGGGCRQFKGRVNNFASRSKRSHGVKLNTCMQYQQRQKHRQIQHQQHQRQAQHQQHQQHSQEHQSHSREAVNVPRSSNSTPSLSTVSFKSKTAFLQVLFGSLMIAAILAQVLQRPQTAREELKDDLKASGIGDKEHTISRALRREGLCSRASSRIPLLQKRHFKARLKYANDHLIKPAAF
ncbi:Transposase Tc1-like [Trinorchestia longiramus]|nr:Transposase Tc1-like [Trinorchestia longiramus]